MGDRKGRPTERDVVVSAENTKALDAQLRSKGVTDHDRHILLRFASVLNERGRTGAAVAWPDDGDMRELQMRPEDLDG